jgi:hypothetical protein
MPDAEWSNFVKNSFPATVNPSVIAHPSRVRNSSGSRTTGHLRFPALADGFDGGQWPDMRPVGSSAAPCPSSEGKCDHSGRPEPAGGSLRRASLTHAHFDHSGRSPLLVKQTFGGPVIDSAATSPHDDLVSLCPF